MENEQSNLSEVEDNKAKNEIIRIDKTVEHYNEHVPLNGSNGIQEEQLSQNSEEVISINHPIIEFSNPQVDLSSLPRLEKINYSKLQEDSLYVGYINIGITCLISLVIAAMVGFFSDTVRQYTLLIYLIIILIFMFMAYAEFRSFRNSGYALRQEDLFYKTGWLWTSMLAIPYKRIQHLEVTQGPISRLFDLANISVYTAGGSSSDMEIEGVKQDEAESIKAFILQKNKNIKDSNSENVEI
jgi:uncharacterized protein